MFIQRPAPVVEKDLSKEPAIYRRPADMEKAELAISQTRDRLADLEKRLFAAITVQDRAGEESLRVACRTVRQELYSLELHKGHMERGE